MRYGKFNENGRIIESINDETVSEVPDGYKELTDQQWLSRFDLELVGNNIVHNPIAIPQDVKIEQAIFAVKKALQTSIDQKAISLGFSNGNSLMLYAGFTNAYKAMATKFSTWEASVWVEAEAYKAQVLAGNQPVLSPEEAVAMMPVYPT